MNECTVANFWEACVLNSHPLAVVAGLGLSCITFFMVLSIIAFLIDVLLACTQGKGGDE
jgi:hypothetical protein